MKSTKLFILFIATCLTYSCNTKNENSNTTQDIQNVNNDIESIASKIANSSTYNLLDSLQAEMNIECRTAYNEYLMSRKENNFAEILRIYQSNIPFPQKRERLQQLGLLLPQKLDDLASEIQKTGTKLSVEFPILTQRSPKKIISIKPQSGLDNPLNTKL